jgi:hypothetical protein
LGITCGYLWITGGWVFEDKAQPPRSTNNPHVAHRRKGREVNKNKRVNCVFNTFPQFHSLPITNNSITKEWFVSVPHPQSKTIGSKI